MKKRKFRWVRFRHKAYTAVAKLLMGGYVRRKYNVTVEKFKEKKKRQYLIVFNHQTAFDQFLVGLAFKGQIYYVASEDLFSNGFVSKLLKHAVAPIPIKKQTSDPRAVMDCVRVAKQGGTIAVAPEGNRTFSGKTEFMNPSIAKLAKLLKLPVVIFKIEGGYGVHPRWSDAVRKGKMRAYVSRVLEPEEYCNLNEEQIYSLICKELYVNEAAPSGNFYHKRNAEYLERVLYVCPHCGLSEIFTDGDKITCKKCNKQATYLPDKRIKGDFGFNYVNDWYEYQQNYVNSLDLRQFFNAPAFTDSATLYQVILYDRKRLLLPFATVSLFGDKISVFTKDYGRIFSFERITGISVLGRNKLNVYTDDGKVFQFKGNRRFNAVKYVNFYYRYQNVKGESNGKFLGL